MSRTYQTPRGNAPSGDENRETLVAKSEIFETIARYEDMMHCMRAVVEGLNTTSGSSASECLDKHERTMLSVAYKHVVGARRNSWRAIRKAEKAEANADRAETTREYRETIADELRYVCLELIGLIDDRLLPIVKEAENDIFYHKMKGDYYRYLAEVEVDDDTKAEEFVEQAAKNYHGAAAYAQTDLAATHPIFLGLTLNYSVFLHEMREDRVAALEMAQKAYDEAVDEMETVRDVDESRYSEAANLIMLLGENIRVWSEPSTAKGGYF